MAKKRIVIHRRDLRPGERIALFVSREIAEERMRGEIFGWCPYGDLGKFDEIRWQWGVVERDASALDEITAPGESQARNERLAELGVKIGKLVQAKNLAYGNSAGNAGAIMRILYPNGVQPHQYDDALLVVRVLDKLSRIAQRGADGKDKGGESPWSDLAGYSILGWAADIEAGRVKE